MSTDHEDHNQDLTDRQDLRDRRDLRDPLVIVIDSLYDETFSLEEPSGAQHHWNVTKARRMAEHKCPMQEFWIAGQVIKESLHANYDGLDEAYALTTDLTKPLLFVTLNGVAQLIDGWHRLMKAVILGVAVLPCYVLTEAQANACLIMKMPPGHGIDWGQKTPPPQSPPPPSIEPATTSQTTSPT